MNDAVAIASREDLSLAEFDIYRAVVARRRSYFPIKRGVDILLSATMLILFSPLLLGAAALIRMDSSGPILYRTRRHGRNMQPFMMLKFRSMVVAREADDLDFKRAVSHGGVLAKSAADPRITPIGRWLRRWSIDELPQLINVLRGDMSLIGPRPVMPEMLDPFPVFAHARALVRPGVGGLWQVRERGNATHVGFMWAHDLEYLDRMSFRFDMTILMRTALAALRRTGAA